MIAGIAESMRRFPTRNAMLIRGTFFTYGDLAQKVSDLKSVVVPLLASMKTKYVGVVVREDLDSYAACLAVLLSSCGYVPLNPLVPTERSADMLDQCGVELVFSTNPEADRVIAGRARLVDPRAVAAQPLDLTFPAARDDDPAYVIFTSGSTGKPKGTPITRANLDAFLDSMDHHGWTVDENDGFLQMSSMTFDMSILTFIIPLTIGACVYSVPEDEIKYLYGLKLIQEQPITVIAVVPSTLSLWKRYFDEIRLPRIRYAQICAEAFPIELADLFRCCIPDGRILNLYGPTEGTVLSHIYWYEHGTREKSHNGILSLGSVVKNQHVILIDEAGNEVPVGTQGEACISGPQITAGYIGNPQKNAEAFFLRDGQRYYRTGDNLIADVEGDYFYVGRKDHQVKIDGHRVELGEIEQHMRIFCESDRVAAVAFKNDFGTYQLHVFAEGLHRSAAALKAYLKSKLPYYMVPSGVTFLEALPLNDNGKIDRPALVKRATQKR